MAVFLNYLYRALSEVQYFGFLMLVFAASALSVGGLTILFTRRNVLQERLAKFAPNHAVPTPTKSKLVEEEESGGFVTRIVAPLHAVIAPSEEAERKKLRLTLIQAGFRSQRAYRNYLALRVLCGILFPLAYIYAAFFYQLSLQALFLGFALAGVGFFLPVWVVRYLIHRRKREISRALPDALDLMVVCGEAGLGLDLTLKRVGEEIRPLSTELSDEFFLTNLEIQAGKPRDDAFKSMSLRTGVPEINNLLTVLGQASRFGTSIAQALRVHAEDMRVKRRQVAEERAAKLAVKLLFPLIFFIFPALFVVLVGPAAVRIMRDLLPVLGGLGS